MTFKINKSTTDWHIALNYLPYLHRYLGIEKILKFISSDCSWEPEAYRELGPVKIKPRKWNESGNKFSSTQLCLLVNIPRQFRASEFFISTFLFGIGLGSRRTPVNQKMSSLYDNTSQCLMEFFCRWFIRKKFCENNNNNSDKQATSFCLRFIHWTKQVSRVCISNKNKLKIEHLNLVCADTWQMTHMLIMTEAAQYFSSLGTRRT